MTQKFVVCISHTCSVSSSYTDVFLFLQSLPSIDIPTVPEVSKILQLQQVGLNAHHGCHG